MNRAWSLLEIKSIDDGGRTFEGIASTPTLDMGGDSMNPAGAQFTLPMPLKWEHGRGAIKDPVGWITDAKPNKDGIHVKGRFATVDEPQSLKDDLDRAWALVKSGLVRGLSIGWKAIDGKPMKGGFRWEKWSWHETSAVAIGMNTEASITAIKSADLAASGNDRSVVRLDHPPPGATGSQTKPAASRFFFDPSKGKDMKTIQEQIAAFEAKRAASVARMDELITKAGDEGRTFDETETQENAGLAAEVKQIDDHLVILRAAEKRVVSGASPVTTKTGTTQEAPGASAPVQPITFGKSNLPKGTAFTRFAIAVLRSKGDSYRMMEIAKQWKDTTPEVEIAIKTTVAAGNTTDSTWAAPLVVYQNMANEFIEILRPATIIGQIQGLRRVPFNISMPRATAGTSSAWVGEDDPKPVSRMSLETITLGHSKIATIVVLTEELVQDSSPAAELVVRQDMIDAVGAYADSQFIDPTVSASGTIRPASITNGLTTHNMTGTAVANVLTDMQTLMQTMITANIRMRSPVWIMHPRSALYLSLLLSPLGTMQFPGINMSGGTFLGYPVITSASVPIDTGADTYIVLLDASEILLADDGGIRVDVSREASLQMQSAPTDSAQSQISLWQNNLVGLRVEQRINYRRRRDAAVSVLSAVSY